jgi:glycosyltransferase involved in cell wall biosynthesis
MALNGLDVFCSASLWGEGFSNSVAEAMACGLRCVVTDVGDSATIVGAAGMVVPPGDAAALARAIRGQADAPRGPFDRARRRIADNFSIDRMVDSTLALLERLAGEADSAAPG